MADLTSHMTSTRNFEFVVSNGPKPPKDPALWTKIRKQAMRDVAIARKRKSRGTKDSSCDDSSAWISTSDESSEDSPPDKSSESTQISLFDGQSQHPYNDADVRISYLTTPYERLRATFNVDIQDLAALTSCFGVSTTTVVRLGDQDLLTSCLGHRVDGYLEYIPSRYGISPCVTAVVDCVTSKLSSRMSPYDTNLQRKAVQMYTKALEEVQTSISNKETVMEDDTLCAVHLLALHEMLDPTKKKAWQQHVAGSTRLIKARTPSGITTDFGKALLLGIMGSECTEALREGRPCFLDDEEWQKICLSSCKDSTWLTTRHPLAVTSRLTEARLAGILVDVSVAVSSGEVFDLELLKPLQERCQKFDRDILACMEGYKNHLVATSLLTPPTIEIDMRREIVGGLTECLLIGKRLLAATHEFDRLRYEVEAQALAMLLSDMQKGHTPKHGWIFTSLEIGLVEAIKATREMWEEDVSHLSVEDQQSAARKRYMAFLAAAAGWE